MLSFQEFQSVVTQKFPHCNWTFEQLEFTVIGEIKNSRVGVCYLCRLNRFIVILQNNDKDYGDQTTIATDIKFIHDAVVSYIQSGF